MIVCINECCVYKYFVVLHSYFLIKMPSVQTLSYIAGIGSLVVVTTGYSLRISLLNKYKQSEFYKESLSLVKGNPIVKEELGEPIIDLKSKEKLDNFKGEDDFGHWTRIPVKGSKSAGTMKYWLKVTNKEDNEPDISLNRVEFQFNHIRGRRLLLKNTLT